MLKGIGGAIVGVLVLMGAVRAEIIDRIVAIVESEIVTLSDVRGALRLGLVPGEGPQAARAAIDLLVDRQLMLSEVDRYGPPEPPAADVDAALEAVRARFLSESDFESALREAGFSRDDLRRRLRNDLRIQIYLGQRFGAGLQPTEAEVLAYYQANPESFVNGRERPFAEVSDLVRARMVAEQRERLVRDWLAGLRRRAAVTILYLP